MPSGDVERTLLASERTYLAWWRTGIAALAAGSRSAGSCLRSSRATPGRYVALGATLAAAGIFAIVMGSSATELERAIREGREPDSGDMVMLAMAVVGVGVGFGCLLLVILAP